MVCRRAGFNANQAGFLPSVQRDDLGGALPSFDDRLPGGVDAMNLKPMLGKIETDHGTMHSQRLLSIVAFTDDHLMAHRYRRAGVAVGTTITGRPPHRDHEGRERGAIPELQAEKADYDRQQTNWLDTHDAASASLGPLP
jgi:hypothetical protein